MLVKEAPLKINVNIGPYIEVPRSEDCFKHLVLVCLLGEMTSEQEGFTYVDAHAGRVGVWQFDRLWGLGCGV